jgi:succinyl-diaminopimelate desuccinylase
VGPTVDVALPAATVTTVLDLSADAVTLTAAVCDIESVSGAEGALADAVERALRPLAHLEVVRDGDAVLARTRLGRDQRVLLAGHLDTVPLAGNLPTRLDGVGDDAVLVGRGTVDMKGGVAVMLRVAATVPAPTRDVTFVFYDHEEVEAELNGLGRLARTLPHWLDADFAVLLEPSNGTVEGGCNGTMRVEVTTRGVAAHSARSWTGRNAIHDAGPVLDRLRSYPPREVEVDGLVYREGLNAVGISGGIAGNVIPDVCVVTVNYRFAPDRSIEQAHRHLQEVFAGHEVALTDAAAAAIGQPPAPKYGWTDVARFSELGVPAVNFGPGDPNLAHSDDERCPVVQLLACEEAMRAWLS